MNYKKKQQEYNKTIKQGEKPKKKNMKLIQIQRHTHSHTEII